MQTCLGTRDSKVVLDEFFDLNEQSLIRSDCMRIAKSLESQGTEQLAIAGDIESMITTLCKDFQVPYSSNNGWMEVMRPLLTLKEPKHEVYGILSAIVTRFLPRLSSREQGFHLLRLLILYHDPELCSFLDSKKIHPEAYASFWFRSLFASRCSLEVTLVLWDAYFLSNDPFLMFFIALVLLINSRDQILEMKDSEQEAIISSISNIPKALEVDDVSDLLTLIDTHYSAHTPCLSVSNFFISCQGHTDSPLYLDSICFRWSFHLRKKILSQTWLMLCVCLFKLRTSSQDQSNPSSILSLTVDLLISITRVTCQLPFIWTVVWCFKTKQPSK